MECSNLTPLATFGHAACPSMAASRLLSLLVLLAFTVLGGAPTLTFPPNLAYDQPTDLVLNWEPGSLTNYVANGGFESGSAAWGVLIPWRVTADAPSAFEGTRFAEIPIRNNNLPRFSEAVLLQEIKLPGTGSGARLVWWDNTTGLGDPERRPHFKVDLQVVGSRTAEVIYDAICGLENVAPWNQHEVDVSAYLGQSFKLTFSVTNQIGSAQSCAARVDGVRLEVLPASVEYEVYLGSTASLGSAQLLGTAFEPSWSLTGLSPGSTNYWKIVQVTDGVRTVSPVFRFTVGGSAPEAPSLMAEQTGEGLQLRALTQPGGFYQFEQADTPDSAVWEPLGDEIGGDGSVASVEVPFDSEVRFFRLRITR